MANQPLEVVVLIENIETCYPIITKDDENVITLIKNPVFPQLEGVIAEPQKKFKFHQVSQSNQEQLFKNSALNLVQDFLMGKNTLFLIYGASEAGKNCTMLGTFKDAGLIPRSLDVVFNSIKHKLITDRFFKPTLDGIKILHPNEQFLERDQENPIKKYDIQNWKRRGREEVCFPDYDNADYHYSVWVSFCEIYNEQAFDLLGGCDKNEKRVPLRITNDRKGDFYAIGLKEIHVRSADEAIRAFLYGKNCHSRRSHCIFTVKLIRWMKGKPTVNVTRTMAFVDITGTMRKGERLKEAGNINTSFLNFGRCLEDVRSHKRTYFKKSLLRQSKLTRLFVHFLCGPNGRAAMYVNVSPSLYEETAAILEFSAGMEQVLFQPPLEAVFPTLRPSRFQRIVDKFILRAKMSYLIPRDTEAVEQNDPQERIRELQMELAKMKSETAEKEQKIRDECCDQWTERYTNMEATWTKRLEETKARYEEFFENRVDNEEMNSMTKKRKLDGREIESYATLLKDKDDRIEILEDSNQRLNNHVEKLRERLKVSQEGKAELQQKMTFCQLEAAASSSRPKINFLGEDEDEDEASYSGNTVTTLQAKLDLKEEMLKEGALEFWYLKQQMAKVKQQNEQLEKKYLEKSEESAKIEAQLQRSNLMLADVNERLESEEVERFGLLGQLSSHV